MKRWKLNISSWYSLGLTALLVISCLVVSTGMAWARYRTEETESIYFKAREPVSVYLGKVEYGEGNAAEGEFVQTNEGSWELNEDGQLQLRFAVANGTSEAAFEERNQEVYVRIVGSLGIQTVADTISLKLTYPNEEKPDTPNVVKATAVRIDPNSTLYSTYGDGWVFTFREEGEELTWTLEGGELSYIEMDLTVEGGTMADTSLLQLQIASRYIKE